MRRSAAILSAFLIIPIGLALAAAQEPARRSTKAKSAKADSKGEATAEKFIKTDREWAAILTRGQFLVTRLKETEPPFTGKYVNNHARGTYHCVCCEAELFASKAKFDS